MTQRERQTPDAGSAAPACAADPAAPVAPPLAGPPAAARNGVGGLWEDLFHRASPGQQQDLLALAGRQGIVYAHQVAVGENGNGAARATRRTLLPALLNGQTKELEAVRPSPLETVDAALDPWQRAAVARAVQTPDICLIQGTPGTGKSRVIAEILLQAARRGERVLFVAPAAAALDRVLEQLAGNDAVCAVRCPAGDEVFDALPACIRRQTVAERQRYFQEHTLPTARQAADAARTRWEETQKLETAFAELDTLLAANHRIVDERTVLDERRAGLAAAVAAELTSPPTDGTPAPLAAQRAEFARRRDTAVVDLDTRLTVRRTDRDKCQAECDRLTAELAPLTPLLEARQHNRWWSGVWWRARNEKDLAPRVEQRQARHQALAREVAAVQQDVDKLQAERRQVDEQFLADETRLRDGEVTRRQNEIDAQLSALSAEQQQLEVRRQQIAPAIDGVAQGDRTPAALSAARERWAERLRADRQQHECAAAWAGGVADALATLPQRLTACANVVAAVTTALAADPHFGDRSGIAFDLLVLDEAEQVTESEFVNLARRSSRWVLVGQPVPDVDGPAVFPRRAHPAKPLRPAALRPGFFQRLWNTLHGDPRRLPYVWAWRDGRLSCCLHAVPADHRPYLETEGVADRPEIELSIVAPPRRPSYLAEVVFPAAMTIHEAKEYIYRELGELSVQAHGHSLRWSESNDHLTLHLAAAADAAAAAVPVALEPGVCELVGPLPAARDGAAPWHTCGLTFERAAGWTPDRAVRWVETNLKTRDLGRTAFLATPYRMNARLAQVLDDLLFDELNSLDCARYAGLSHDAGTAPVEFVAVPAGFNDIEPPRHGEADGGWGGVGTAVATRPRAVKGGAGLEIDLADPPRRLDPLPPELRPLLPAAGLVNYIEAQAVVRALEQLVADPALRYAGANRPVAPCEQTAADGSCVAAAGCTPQSHCPVVAVVALYPAQAALLAHLIRQNPALADGGVRVEVGSPTTFRQRECLVALVSLTRSHAHRAVSFGDYPQALALALTRAAGRVVLFGDPGTLLRRSPWPGEIDQLDEADALRERDLTGRLVRYLQGQGAHAHAFQLREGNGP